jgi:glucosylceramidase
MEDLMFRLPTRHLIVISFLCLYFFSLSFLTPATHAATTRAATGPNVKAWLTTTDRVNQLTQQANQTFTSGNGTASSTIDVNENQQFQQMVGFGAAMTDTSAYLIGTQMNSTQESALMRALFSQTSGIGVNFVRIPMGSSDFTATPASNPAPYSYDDMPAGQTDPNLTNFSISHDTSAIIPTLQQALQINSSLRFMANPWSPPAWMKTNDSMINGGNLTSSSYGPLAQYFVKFIQAYQAQGLPIYAITPQNEPGASTDYSSMVLPAASEASFIANNLGPALSNANLSPKILAWDQASTNGTYPETVLGNSAASAYISGIAWHCYDSNLPVMSDVYNFDQSKDVYETECSTGANGIAPYSAIDTALDSVQNWAKVVELWNIALNASGGPKMGSGCTNCTGLATIDSSGNYTLTDNYYGLGQVSKFALPGAYHIGSSTADKQLNTAAFKNPDGSKVLVVHNTSSSTSKTFNVDWEGTQSFSYTLPAGGIVTFQWSGTPVAISSGYAVNAGGSATGSFAADGYYSGGNTYSTTASINTSGVTNPAPQAVYQTERFGNMSYTFPNLIPKAQYTVRLHFAELYWNSSGKRTFNVSINGTQVLSNFDIFATAGGEYIAIVEPFTTIADSNGQIAIQFTSVVNNAKVSGIEIALASYAVNSGGNASGSFTTDFFGSGGSDYPTTASINTSGVTNPAPQTVYKNERFGDFTYTIPGLTAGATYTVRLHFAELNYTASGDRIFNVTINGTQVLSNFDVFATAGGEYTAIVEPFTATADSSGQITIRFMSLVTNASINGIEVIAA